MATYKPYRKTESGKEEIKIPYSVLSNPPVIPTKTSQLTNDSNFVKSNAGAFTGNVTAENFNSRFSLQSVPYGTAIGANVNLNTTTYLKVGNYYCSADNTVATLTNCPTKQAFMMTVYSPLGTTVDNETTGQWVYRVRKLMTYTGEEYVQPVNSGSTAGTFTYGTWRHIAKTSDIPDVSGKLTGTKFVNDSGVTPSFDTYLPYSETGGGNTKPAYLLSFINNSAGSGLTYSSTLNALNATDSFKVYTQSSLAPSECTQNGFYYVKSDLNSLTDKDGNPFLQYHTDNDFRILTTAYSNLWLQQIATDFRSDHVYIRRCQSGTWYPWEEVAKSSDVPTFSLSGTTLTITL